MNGRIQRKYRKTIETLLYLINKDHRLYWVLKMIWLAERIHLSRYGSMILDDRYIAMSHGPVPSLAYDILKAARKDGCFGLIDPEPKSVFEAPNERTVNPLREPDLSMLSESEIECLEEAYNQLKDLSFGAVKEFSHTPSYKKAGQDDTIPFEEFVSDLENGKEVLAYLRSI